MEKRAKRTKIVATVGPATGSVSMMRALKKAGVDVVRCNFSHGTHEEHGRYIDAVNAVRNGTEMAILQDLPGPKIRFGRIPDGSVEIASGDEVVLSSRANIDKGEIPVEYKDFSSIVSAGDNILIDDGTKRIKVLGVRDGKVTAGVEAGGKVLSFKGINIPRAELHESAFTDEDKKHLAFGVRRGVDMVAVSFVGSAADIHKARAFLKRKGAEAVRLIAKIERESAIANIEEILEAADGIMVARGDMGVEMDFEKVPFIQKELIQKARHFAKPVITATHMLESMLYSVRPTRAEVADITNAVLDGTDAVMLSEETAIGRYPEETVRVMADIVREAERHLPSHNENVGVPRHIASSIARSAVTVAEEVGAGAIFVLTESGSSARFVSRYRPRQLLYALTPNEHTLAHLKLSWGVEAIRVPGAKDINDATALVRSAITKHRIKAGKYFVLCAGIPFETPGTTNLVFVEKTRG